MKSLELLEARQRIIELETRLRSRDGKRLLRGLQFKLGQEAIRENFDLRNKVITLKRQVRRRDNLIVELTVLLDQHRIDWRKKSETGSTTDRHREVD